MSSQSGMAAGEDLLLTTLGKARLRLGVQQWIRLSTGGFFVGTCLSCVWLVVTKFFVALGDPLPVVLLLTFAGWILGSIAALVKRPSLPTAALELDRRLGLKERLTTSLELAEVQGPMVDAVHRDARARIAGLNFNRHFPLATTSKMRWVYAPILLFLIGYIFLPEFDLLNHRERVAEAIAEEKAIRVTTERIRAAVRPLLRPETREDTEASDIVAKVDQIAKDLQSKNITEKQALARMTNLSQELKKHTDRLRDRQPIPKALNNRMSKFGITKEAANDIQKGRFGDAAKKMSALRKKLEKGGLSEAEMKDLEKELGELAKMMSGEGAGLNEALAEALAKAAKGLNSKDLAKALEAMKAAELSLADLQSLTDQLKAMDDAWGKMCQSTCNAWGQCQGLYGKKGFGLGFKPGWGPGMGGPGRGRGNTVGDLPDPDVDFSPSVLKGPMGQGKILASIIQKAEPEMGAEASVEYIAGAFKRVQQEAEQALTREEIPDGSKEFIRQYFGALEPEKAP